MAISLSPFPFLLLKYNPAMNQLRVLLFLGSADLPIFFLSIQLVPWSLEIPAAATHMANGVWTRCAWVRSR